MGRFVRFGANLVQSKAKPDIRVDLCFVCPDRIEWGIGTTFCCLTQTCDVMMTLQTLLAIYPTTQCSSQGYSFNLIM